MEEENFMVHRGMQGLIAKQRETSFRKRWINRFNRHCAEAKSGLLLRSLQPSSISHCTTNDFEWTDEEANSYLTHGTLPRDLVTIEEEGQCSLVWIFDARGLNDSNSLVVELDDLDVKPGLENFPATCIFDLGHTDLIAVILSEFLTMVPVGKRKVKFIISEETGEDAKKFLQEHKEWMRSLKRS